MLPEDEDCDFVEEDRWMDGFEDGCRCSLRFFEHSDNNTFSIFCESGLERTWIADVANEDSIDLTIKIPIPPDELIKAAAIMQSISISGKPKKSSGFKRLVDSPTIPKKEKSIIRRNSTLDYFSARDH